MEFAQLLSWNMNKYNTQLLKRLKALEKVRSGHLVGIDLSDYYFRGQELSIML